MGREENGDLTKQGTYSTDAGKPSKGRNSHTALGLLVFRLVEDPGDIWASRRTPIHWSGTLLRITWEEASNQAVEQE